MRDTFRKRIFLSFSFFLVPFLPGKRQQETTDIQQPREKDTGHLGLQYLLTDTNTFEHSHLILSSLRSYPLPLSFLPSPSLILTLSLSHSYSLPLSFLPSPSLILTLSFLLFTISVSFPHPLQCIVCVTRSIDQRYMIQDAEREKIHVVVEVVI